MKSKPAQGFTLIELMIVITIIGVMAGIVSLSVTTGDPAKEAQKEAKRFIAVMSMALDESAFNQQDLGIHLEDDGYEFLKWARPVTITEDSENDAESEDAEQLAAATQTTTNTAEEPEATWQLITEEPSLEFHELPEDIRLEIEIEDSELLATEEDGETELTKTNLNLDEIGPEIEEEEVIEPPHVYILSSGELAPAFRLGFYHVEKPDVIYYVVGDEMGRVDFEKDEFLDE
ncbi:MAG: type II secretion system minor pseudopilin GspH [Pseudomonadales bacterium]|nr:type II secretion system minor pseudopilin GspH [Pseudomonadales bacterium]